MCVQTYTVKEGDEMSKNKGGGGGGTWREVGKLYDLQQVDIRLRHTATNKSQKSAFLRTRLK